MNMLLVIEFILDKLVCYLINEYVFILIKNMFLIIKVDCIVLDYILI